MNLDQALRSMLSSNVQNSAAGMQMWAATKRMMICPMLGDEMQQTLVDALARAALRKKNEEVKRVEIVANKLHRALWKSACKDNHMNKYIIVMAIPWAVT